MIRRPPRSTLFPSRRSSDLSLRASGLMNSLPGHMSKILHFPLRDVDREFLFFQLEQLSKLVSKKTSPRSIDDDNAMGSMLIDEPEELGDRRSSPAEIVVYRDLQGNELPGVPSCEDSQDRKSVV